MRNLSKRQEKFVNEFLKTEDAELAKNAAGYARLTPVSSILAVDSVKKAIDSAREKRAKYRQIPGEKLVDEAAALALVKITDIIEWDDDGIRVKNSSELSDSAAAAIKSIQMTSKGLQVVLYDKVKALEIAMRAYGLFDDKLTIKGTVDVSALEEARQRIKDIVIIEQKKAIQ